MSKKIKYAPKHFLSEFWAIVSTKGLSWRRWHTEEVMEPWLTWLTGLLAELNICGETVKPKNP